MRSNQLKLLLNTLSLIGLIFVNYLTNTKLFGQTVGEVSKKYDSLIVPAGYAFSIWGVIYILLISFVIHQWILNYKHQHQEVIDQTGYWFLFSNLCNGAWVLFWTNEYIGISLILMAGLLLSLIMLVRNLKMELWDAPLRIIVFVWWPICIYLGWIVVATVANVAAFLVSIGWHGGIFSQTTWTVVMIVVSVIIYASLIYKRNLREAAMVGVWAYLAIAIRQWNSHLSIVITCFAGMAILLVYTSVHAYKNRATLPFLNKRG